MHGIILSRTHVHKYDLYLIPPHPPHYAYSRIEFQPEYILEAHDPDTTTTAVAVDYLRGLTAAARLLCNRTPAVLLSDKAPLSWRGGWVMDHLWLTHVITAACKQYAVGITAEATLSYHVHTHTHTLVHTDNIHIYIRIRILKPVLSP